MARKKILLVDDSNTVLMVEKLILAKDAYDLVFAKDGQEGVEKAIAEKPDLILMDATMPRLDGFGACKHLRTQGDTAGIPIIIVTTREEEQNVKTGYETGCIDYVTKPIDGNELLAKVRHHLGQVETIHP